VREQTIKVGVAVWDYAPASEGAFAEMIALTP